MRQYFVQSEEAKQLSRGALGVNGLEAATKDSTTLQANNKRSTLNERRIDKLYKANLMNACSALFGLASLAVSLMLVLSDHSKCNALQA